MYKIINFKAKPMKKILLSILFVYFCCPTVLLSKTSKNTDLVKTENFLTEYRSYPFQWIYPEYFYKAEVIRVNKENNLSQEGYTKVDFFGLTAYIPSQYTSEIKRKHDIMYFKTKTGDWIMMIKSSDSSILCSETKQGYMKDYCSAFKTPQEYIHKLYMLTPDTVESMGDKWIVHGKGVVFENAKKIEVYSDDEFMAYVKVIKDSLVKEKTIKFSHEIILFHAKGPLNAHITISFSAKDDTLLKHFISTIN